MIRIEGRAALIVSVIVLFWFSAWGLLDEGVDFAQERWGYPKAGIYAAMFALSVVYILCAPDVLIRI
jgi:hypothetical protein